MVQKTGFEREKKFLRVKSMVQASDTGPCLCTDPGVSDSYFTDTLSGRQWTQVPKISSNWVWKTARLPEKQFREAHWRGVCERIFQHPICKSTWMIRINESNMGSQKSMQDCLHVASVWNWSDHLTCFVVIVTVIVEGASDQILTKYLSNICLKM